MAKDVKNCVACEDLTEYAPEFVANGVTNNICNSLKNNTGFNPALSKKHENCDDLSDANDCLIGNMVDEVERFDVCDWKDYARLFAANTYNVLKAMICSECGIWANIKNIWTSIENISTTLNNLINTVEGMEKGSCAGQMAISGKALAITEDMFHRGTGITLEGAGSVASNVDLRLTGGTYRVQGSITVQLSGTAGGLNMENYWGSLGFQTRGSSGQLVPRAGMNSSGQSTGHSGSFFVTDKGNWVICYLIFPKTLAPWVKWFGRGVGNFQDSAVGQLTAAWADGDENATLSGQWGTGSPNISVDQGCWGLKVGLANITSWDSTTTSGGNTVCNCTFNIIGQYTGNPNEIVCN